MTVLEKLRDAKESSIEVHHTEQDGLHFVYCESPTKIVAYASTLDEAKKQFETDYNAWLDSVGSIYRFEFT
jgi:hypothetical protein